MDISKYESQERLLKYPTRCLQRTDDTGFWNTCKAWYWYPIHLLSCASFVALMFYAIDGRDFMTGSPPDIYAWPAEREFYQTEINGFISAMLVVLRLIASCGAGLLIWRFIYLLLEKSGLTLAEICRMANLKLPILPHMDSPSHFYWSCLAFVVTLLLWPPFVAAPLANSALEWIPATRVARRPAHPYNVSTLSQSQSKWEDIQYENNVMNAIMSASLMISQDPDFMFTALDDSQVPLRRYIYGPSSYISESGVGRIDLPYFKVERIEWLDAPQRLYGVIDDYNNASMLPKTPNPSLFAKRGMLGFFQEEKWDFTEARDQYNTIAPDTFVIKRNITIFVGDFNLFTKFPDGTSAKEATACPTHDNIFFDKLPSVQQEAFDIYIGDEWRAKRCYMLAEVTMKAGIYPNRRVNITLPGSSVNMNMINALDPAETNPTLLPDKNILAVTDMMSDVIGMVISLDVMSKWRSDIELWIKGSLTNAYIATWSVFPAETNVTKLNVVPYEDVIRARVIRRRLYIWLGMNSTLAIAALIAAFCGLTTKTKTIRDTTLAAITLDLRHLAHVNNDGLCNAVTLKKKDHDMKRLKWRNDTDLEMIRMDGDEKRETCCKELVLS